MAQKYNPGLLSVIVYEERRILFEGEAISLTSKNQKGVFDVLPEHGNLIAAVNEYLLIRQTQDTEKRLHVTNGILQVEGNRVVVFV